MKKKVISVIISLIMLFTMAFSFAACTGDNELQAQIDDLKNQVEQLEEQIEQLEEQIGQLEEQIKQEEEVQNGQSDPETQGNYEENMNKVYSTSGNVNFNVSYYNMDLRRSIECGSGKVYVDKVYTFFKEWDDISQYLPDFQSFYDDDFFQDKALILCIREIGNGGAKLSKVEISVEDNIATMNVNIDHGILSVMTEWAIVVEIDKKDYVSVNEFLLELNETMVCKLDIV